MFRISLFLLVIIAASSKAAGNFYKCETESGVVFSYSPCGKPKEMTQEKVPQSRVAKPGKQTIEQKCLAMIVEKYRFKDPQSARVEGSMHKWLTDRSGVRYALELKINARNSFGGYVGAKPFLCFLSGDGKHLSNIQELVK